MGLPVWACAVGACERPVHALSVCRHHTFCLWPTVGAASRFPSSGFYSFLGMAGFTDGKFASDRRGRGSRNSNLSTPAVSEATFLVVLVKFGHGSGFLMQLCRGLKLIFSLQGMNFIAGYLILITKSEEESFWLLEALVGRILPDYYSPAMLGLQTDQEVLGELVRTKLPAVAALMDGHGVLWTLVVSRWFICLFVDILPMETVLRIWDCLFNEGSKIIFRVALTLIKQHQAFILEATSVADICERFKEITRGSFVTECHTFMQKIFTEPGSLSMATIIRLRESCRARLQAQG
nr:growth hormone-regulated TBC protein 1 [Neomonachus schauinslandi]